MSATILIIIHEEQKSINLPRVDYANEFLTYMHTTQTNSFCPSFSSILFVLVMLNSTFLRSHSLTLDLNM